MNVNTLRYAWVLYLVYVIIPMCNCWFTQMKHHKPVCEEIFETNGTISTPERYDDGSYKACWKIRVSQNKFIRIQIQSLFYMPEDCADGYLLIREVEDQEFCGELRVVPTVVTSIADIEITFYASQGFDNAGFKLDYEIKDIECSRRGSFKCSEFSCIPRSKVCDEVMDCENGADEIGCERGITSVAGVRTARFKAIEGLLNKRTSSWGWQENTARAVTALFLGGGAHFNGSDFKEELMAKQAELKTAVAFLKKPVPIIQLSMFINALLVTCHNPRRFHGQDLIQILKDQLDTEQEDSGNFSHPIAYLALCNAKEPWPTKAISDLTDILSNGSEYPFFKDYQAFAVMAISCVKKSGSDMNDIEYLALREETEKKIKSLKEKQLPDGSFGSIHSTSLITQALIASGQELVKDWKLKMTVKYLIEELKNSEIDFIALYLTLPVLNRKSLADIATINCSSNPRKQGYADALSISTYSGPKIRVQYSLYLGKEKDVIHTISLRVPSNFSALEVMKMAAAEDQKFKFEWKNDHGGIYVYRIAKTSNDPEAGIFWLLYVGTNNTPDHLVHYTKSPDQVALKDEEHLVMWYKSPDI